jgi:ppGpp synthetase/RelA/SpoT-type nucleotidyltranferase
MSGEPFDFNKHRSDATSAYAGVRDKYENFATTIRQLLETCLEGIAIHTIEARAKDVSSFAEKAARPERDNQNCPEYPVPLRDIADLAAARIITYFPKTLQQAETIIEEEFDVLERHDKSSGFETSGRLGYQSIHFLVRLRDSRIKLREYATYKDLVAEIQLRTILQHAWAEMEHDIQYKSPEQIPTELRRRFAALAGLIEIADREFQAIQDADSTLRSEIKASLLEESTLEHGPELSKEGVAANAETGGVEPIAQDEEVRTAARVGDYEHAIQRYDRLIEGEPNQFAHYLGRAKAKFLGGDRSSALADIEEAEKRAPGHAFIQTVRRKIDEGLVTPTPEAKFVAQEQATAGHLALSRGDGEGALAHYESAEGLGFPSHYCAFNKAMAYCLLRRHTESDLALTRLRLIAGSGVKVNCLALHQINAALKEPPAPMDLTGVQSAINEMPQYEFSLSPLRKLISGLTAVLKESSLTQVGPVLAMLRREQ